MGNLSSKAVLISGCDSGFGRALSIKCAKAGMTVFAGCLTEKVFFDSSFSSSSSRFCNLAFFSRIRLLTDAI